MEALVIFNLVNILKFDCSTRTLEIQSMGMWKYVEFIYATNKPIY